ncbi:DUF421 domain-containing protein [Azospirillum soli]|uniref:DUF421 domain-containing protein n=1 Tax=Azospirillum soli TaxID=1304799 RepID=UPI001AEA7129|nr:YetF domain-containing protein [Azospirillum soli]MBP2312582.1 uncharacterized membrane protein YcaP (DUF421 family) [Azospirillum soli]
MDEIAAVVRFALGLGLDGKELGLGQMVLRAVVVYVVTVAMVRLGKKRFMGKATAFDVILGIMLGSVVSRAITGNAPFVPALGAAAMLIALHAAISAIGCRFHGFGWLVKGDARLLVRDGTVDWAAMRRAHLTQRDLDEDLRRHGMTGVDQVTEARLERNGDISVIKAKSAPKVVEIAVADGVQTVRVELG